MTAPKLILEHVLDKEAAHPERVYLTQPVGGGRVIDYTWGQVVGEARRMAAHLRALGLQRGDRVGILSKNCAHFFMAELAIWLGGFTTVAIFPTEGPETVRFVLEHSEAKALFVGKLDTWPRQAPGVPEGLPCIALPLAPEVDFRRWDDVIHAHAPVEGRVARAADELAMIIYTSGSTGQPKGVMHSFGGVTAAVSGIIAAIGLRPDDRAISYLPLAHVYERALLECGSFIGGGHIFFAESLDTFLVDLRRARPTVFASVPRLWMKFQDGVHAKIPPRRLALLLGLPGVGRLVARKILAGLGLESVRLAGSASAPIPAEVLAWYRRLGLTVLEGYGMTEDFGFSHFSRPDQRAPGYVGAPYDGVEVRLSEEGEVLVKSPGRLVGYFKRPDLDAEAFTPDGFFRTGDRGERSADGLLKITGRTKELFKTAKGKYVAPAPIENRLNEHPLVELSCVSGVGQPAAYALVVLAEHLRPHASSPEVRARVERELSSALESINAQLADYERLKMVVVTSEPWTIENGMLTPTMKLKRARIEAAVEARLERWYAERGPVVWH